LRIKTFTDKLHSNSLAASPAVLKPGEVQMPVSMGWLTGFNPEDGGCRFLQYVCNELPDYTASITEKIFTVTTIRNLYLAQLSENS
jgi:hypothetical protein